MSKINVEFDTKEKTLSVKIDGKALASVVGVNLSKSYYSDDEDEFTCSLVTLEKDDTNDIKKYTQIMAVDSEGARGHKSSEFAGFVTYPVESLTKAQSDVKKFFS